MAVASRGTSQTTDLVRYDAMCRAIADAHAVDEVKDIRDKALAWEMYSRQAKNTEAEQHACEIRLRAERKAGALLRQMDKNKGGRPRLDRNHRHDGGGLSTLQELGVSEKQSRQWQKLADVSDDEFNAALADKTAKPTTNGILRASEAPKVKPVSAEALWLWGRLRDFERDGLLDRMPTDIMETMTDEMKDDVHLLAPRVAAWLKRIGACR